MTEQEAIRCLAHIMALTNNSKQIEALDMAMKTLEKQNKYHWHDLRKHPKDLPKTDGEYFTAFTIKNCESLIIYRPNPFDICYRGGFRVDKLFKVIAWREIEPFEESVTE